MVNLSSALSKVRPFKALVIGDIVLDTYTIGKAKRISPEAPVAIVHVKSEEYRPGMAGNVALNLQALGGDVTVVGRVGNDKNGEILRSTLSEMNVEGLFVQDQFSTPVKNRIIADHQQIVRVDHESIDPLPELLEDEIMKKIPQLLEGVQVIAISDYAKGFLTKTLLSGIIEKARALNIPIAVDPKGVDFSKYAGATIIKPNYSEAVMAAGLGEYAPLEAMAEKILSDSEAEMLMITRSEEGVSLFEKGKSPQNFPVRVREVLDVTGAGDTVLAALTCVLANRIPMNIGMHLCNAAAGIAIERFGCARVTIADIAKSILDHDAENKVFDEEHFYALQQVLNERSVTILGLNISEGITPALFKAIHDIADDESDLLVYIREQEPKKEMVDLLSSLNAVDYIVVKSDNLRLLCDLVHPDEVFLYDNQQMVQLDSAAHILGGIYSDQSLS